MSPLRSLVLDCINKKEHSFDPKNKVTVLGLKYFIVLDNDEIEVSENESILDRPHIKYSFTFIKVHYTPWHHYYTSWLAPIIVTNDLKVPNGMIEFNNWFCYFYGQSLNTQPTSLNYKIVDRYEKEMTRGSFTIEFPSPHMTFKKAYNLFMAIGECTSRDSAQLVIDHFKKEDTITKKGLIDELMEEVSDLRIDLNTKDQIIENYQRRFDSIKELINMEE